ncbi:eCIS core domain-containing protein [Deinococcus radiotolerans]|nr:DUF4157 domain-containing protein [Deinococcus radiotolerans]
MPLPRPGVQRSPAAVPAVPLSTPPGVDGVLSALAHAAHRDGHGTPLAPGELAALRDVLGTSVADVRVIRRPEVAPALRAARADGLTLGDTVFLPHDLPLDRPAGLALAAHEFTHARRARDPLFVPSALTHAAPQAADEEAVALATEHAAFEHTPDPAPPRRAPGLPAPWEPLPTWSGEPSLSSGPRPGAARLPAAPAPRPSSPPPGPGAVPWHAAAADRPAPAPPAKAASRPPEDQAVGRRAPQTAAVDLDQMARDVYARLREQLSQEMRRLN